MPYLPIISNLQELGPQPAAGKSSIKDRKVHLQQVLLDVKFSVRELQANEQSVMKVAAEAEAKAKAATDKVRTRIPHIISKYTYVQTHQIINNKLPYVHKYPIINNKLQKTCINSEMNTRPNKCLHVLHPFFLVFCLGLTIKKEIRGVPKKASSHRERDKETDFKFKETERYV